MATRVIHADKQASKVVTGIRDTLFQKQASERLLNMTLEFSGHSVTDVISILVGTAESFTEGSFKITGKLTLIPFTKTNKKQ